MADIPLKCQCGTVQGIAQVSSPKVGNHLVCYCDHCQEFLKKLGMAGLLDEYGGTDIFQMPPCGLKITKGDDLLRCLKLTTKGPLRWYAACCNSPVANTFSAGMPLVGLLTSFIAEDTDRSQLGDVRFYIQGQHATDTPPHSGVHPQFPARLITRIMGQAVWGKLLAKHKPSPFFNDAGKPVSQPRTVATE